MIQSMLPSGIFFISSIASQCISWIIIFQLLTYERVVYRVRDGTLLSEQERYSFYQTYIQDILILIINERI